MYPYLVIGRMKWIDIADAEAVIISFFILPFLMLFFLFSLCLYLYFFIFHILFIYKLMNWEPQKPLRVSGQSGIHHTLFFVWDLSILSLSPFFFFYTLSSVVSLTLPHLFLSTFLTLSLTSPSPINYTHKRKRKRKRENYSKKKL